METRKIKIDRCAVIAPDPVSGLAVGGERKEQASRSDTGANPEKNRRPLRGGRDT